MNPAETHASRVAAGRLAPGLIVALFFLALLEGGLRLADYRGRTATEDPYLGFESIYPLFGEKVSRDGRSVFATQTNKTKFFNYQKSTTPNPPGTFRIFCFGGSTTDGLPFHLPTP